MEGTKKEQDMWVQRKSAEQWRYNKLMTEGADAYRQSDNLRASKFYYEKEKVTGKKSAVVGKCPDAVDDNDFNDGAEAEKSFNKGCSYGRKSHKVCTSKCKLCKILVKTVKMFHLIFFNFILVLADQL